MKRKNIPTIVAVFALAVLLVPLSATSRASSATLWDYALLIIAPDDFIDELQPLKRFKDASARPTILLSLSQVYANPNCSMGVDEPEKIKRCIAHYRQTKYIDYVMLVGDVEKFPVRWAWWGLPGQEGWGVSDLYYADLYKQGTITFDDWDFNNNGLYGEKEFAPDGAINNDRIDFLPDVAVGRIPASTPEEVTAYVNKVIVYEIVTTPFTGTWFKKAGLYTGGWLSSANSVKNDIATFLENVGFAFPPSVKRYWDLVNNQPPPGVPGVIIDDFNSGVGFANYIGHGNRWGWAELGFGTAQLAGLANSERLPVAFAAACDTSMFAWLGRHHPYVDDAGGEHCGTANGETLDPGPYPHDNLPKPDPLQSDGDDGRVWCPKIVDRPVCQGWCYFDHTVFGEEFLFGWRSSQEPVGPTGAIAYLGERSGGQATSVDLDKYFFQAYEQGHMVLGDMWKYMIERYYAQHDLQNSHTWVVDQTQWRIGHVFDEPQKFVLFGDPSLAVGGTFFRTRTGDVYDGEFTGGPWHGYFQYRVTGDVTVPAGQTLTVYPAASALFEGAKKLTAIGADPSKGFRVDGTSDEPAWFLSRSADPQSEHVVEGLKVSGQLRIRNGGQVKLY